MVHINIPDALEHAADAIHNFQQAKENLHEHHYIDALHNAEHIYNDVNTIIKDLH